MQVNKKLEQRTRELKALPPAFASDLDCSILFSSRLRDVAEKYKQLCAAR